MSVEQSNNTSDRSLSKKGRKAERRAIRNAASERVIGRRRMLRIFGGGVIAGATLLISGGLYAAEQLREKTLKEKVLATTWKDAKEPDKLDAFVEAVALGYLQYTQSPRVNKETLLGRGKTNLFRDRQQFTDTVRVSDPGYNPDESQWGTSNKTTKSIYIDLSTLERYAASSGFEAGNALLTALWHEWLHFDTTERTNGSFINSSSIDFTVISRFNNKNEPFRRYKGGIIFSDTDYTFQRWDEVLVETITQRRIHEQVGIQNPFLTGNYEKVGTDILIPFSKSSGVSLDTLYNLYATSDIEGQAIIFGQRLRGSGSPARKGFDFMYAIHQGDAVKIAQLGLPLK